MISISNKKNCCGCNACGDICPRNSITFTTDIEGFWYPEVNKETCIDCHLCEKVCPIINVEKLKKNDLSQSICYAAEHKNLEIIFDSTSGGLFSALSEIMYKDGGYVGGAIFNEDFSVSHFISNKKKDLSKLRSSKYLQSNLEGFFSQVREILNAGNKVLVCGTPCQMSALRSYLRKDYDNLIIVDFICRGINSPKVWHKYLESFKERYGSPVVYCKAKSKEYGWRNLTQKVILENGKHLYETYNNSNFTKGYLSTKVYCRPSCYECKFKGYPRMADITLADFWGIEDIDKTLEKDLGTSLVMINSQKGKQYFEKVKSKIRFIKVPFDTIEKGNPCLNTPLDLPTVDRKQFFEDLDKMSFLEISEKYINNEKTRKSDEGNQVTSSPLSKSEKIRQFIFKILHPRSTYYFYQLEKKEKERVDSLLKYNTIGDIKSNTYIQPDSYCVIERAQTANVVLNGILHLGWKKFKDSHLETRLLIGENSTLQINGNVKIGYGSDIEVFPKSSLVIGEGFASNIATTIICGDSITIGKNVMVGRNVTIRDNNGGHYINRPGYKNSKPVVIGDKVWLCEGCTIMPGVKIGDGAIIGAHSLVVSNVPAHAMVSGNPAQIVDEDVLWKY